jgi:hypothetical protein
VTDEDRRVQEGWSPKPEERGMGPAGKPITGHVSPPPKPNDAATSARPPQQNKPSE